MLNYESLLSPKIIGVSQYKKGEKMEATVEPYEEAVQCTELKAASKLCLARRN